MLNTARDSPSLRVRATSWIFLRVDWEYPGNIQSVSKSAKRGEGAFTRIIQKIQTLVFSVGVLSRGLAKI
jgi:hypothetical protein